MNEALLVMTTFGCQETARAVATELVTQRLVACVNLLPGATSIYQWEGKLCEESEVVAILKTTQEKYPALETTLLELHPYDVPELIALPITRGNPDYLKFLQQQTS